MQTFFGLSEQNKEYIYEEIFQLHYYGNWSFQEAYSLPVQVRKWFIGRLIKEKQAEIDARENKV